MPEKKIETPDGESMEEPVSSLFAGNLEERIKEYEEWVKTVRDPACNKSEGERVLKASSGKATASYEMASLPDGRYAIRYRCEYNCGNYSGVGHPWSAEETRQKCLELFLDTAKKHFSQEQNDLSSNDIQKQARKEMLGLLKGGLFGFMEPEPEK